MKLRHQMLVLLALPLACQLVTVGLMISSFAQVDDVARRETVAKRVISISNDLTAIYADVILHAVTPKFFSSDVAIAPMDLFLDEIEAKNRLLSTLTKDNLKASKLVALIARDSKKFIENIQDYAGSYHPPEREKVVHSQYFEAVEFQEAMLVLAERLKTEGVELRKIYGKEAKEFEPAQLAARQNMRNTFVFAVVANVLLVCVLAVIINKKTLDRLQTLMTNMQFFAKGNQKYQKLDGVDEIAELDKAFQQMADQRNRLEDIRKSMRAMVSHDLRSPLASMRISVEMAMETDADQIPASTSRTLNRLHAELQRLNRLADTLLDIEKIEDGKLETKLEETSCQEISSVAANVMRPYADRRKIVITELIQTESNCMCDKDRTIQVLVNLLSNSVKFAPTKSTIEIQVSEPKPGRICFEVLDQGPGIPPEKVEKLFNKFIQLDQPGEVKDEGSGLGLYICKMLINAQQGELGYRTRPEGGSCFWFELPAASQTT